MAYPIIKSVFDNFTTAYQNARDARAREERAKEQSMRLFEQNLMAQDQNQRAWNQEGRLADIYTNYQSPANALLLAQGQRANELGIQNNQNDLMQSRFNTGVLSGVTGVDSQQRQINTVNAMRDYQLRLAQAKGAGVPQDIFENAANANIYGAGAQGLYAKTDIQNFNPESVRLANNLGLYDLQNRNKAAQSASEAAARPSGVFQSSYTPTVGRTFGATTINPPAAVNAPAMPATTTPVRPALQNSPMATMANAQYESIVQNSGARSIAELQNYLKLNLTPELRKAAENLIYKKMNEVAVEPQYNSPL